MFNNFKKATAKVNGVKIHYRIAGNGPPVLLLHGYPQTHIMWREVAPLLAKNLERLEPIKPAPPVIKQFLFFNSVVGFNRFWVSHILLF